MNHFFLSKKCLLFSLLAASQICCAGNQDKNRSVELDIFKKGSFDAPAYTTTTQIGNKIGTFPDEEKINYATDIVTGAQSISEYLPLLKGKKIAILSNQTGMVTPYTHVLDTLVAEGVTITCIMSPEHGFRGNADAGEHVSNSVDTKTGIPIRSLYGGDKGSSKELLKEVEVMLFDLQDVGTRFYTYYITMIKMMEACAENGVKFIILDRPNPLGFYVDGPILDMKHKSGVGALPIPVVHGMTLGELAYMANEKGWLKTGMACDLTVIKCKNYTHAKLYRLPIKPSPNLPDMRAIYLYPSTCYFEATPISLGRGTDKAFEMYGHPNMKGYSFRFIPRSIQGAKNPPQLDKVCYGVDLRSTPSIEEINRKGINLEYLIDAYTNLNLDDHLFRNFFELLIGQSYVRQMIKEGKTADEIKTRWSADVAQFKIDRKPYLLYPEE